MIHELKTIVIVVSATLASLLVHQTLDQAQASAADSGRPALVAVTITFRSSATR